MLNLFGYIVVCVLKQHGLEELTGHAARRIHVKTRVFPEPLALEECLVILIIYSVCEWDIVWVTMIPVTLS